MTSISIARLNPRTREFASDGALFTASLIWGSTFIIVKQAIETIPVFSFLALRFAFAAVFMLAVSAPRLRRMRLKTLGHGCILGFFLFLTFASQTLSLKYSPASVTAFVSGLFVIITPLFSALMLKKKPHPLTVLGVILSCGGLGLITLNGGFVLSEGIIYALLCAVFISAHIILTDHYSRQNDVFLLTSVQIVLIMGLSAGISAAAEPATLPATWTGPLVAALALTGVLATAAAFLITTACQKYTTPAKAAVIYCMEPVSSLFFSFYIGHEVLLPRQYAGAGVMLAAMIVVEIGAHFRLKTQARRLSFSPGTSAG